MTFIYDEEYKKYLQNFGRSSVWRHTFEKERRKTNMDLRKTENW